jgi:hypothetical protein
MAERPEELNTRPPHAVDQPIDDMLDGRDIHQWPDQFGQVISYIHTALYEDYSKHDTGAMDQQKWHRWASKIAIGAGTVAILLSLIGVVLEAKGSDLGINFANDFSHYFWVAELAFFTVAISMIFTASKYKWHKNWLVERFCAEEYRTRKFRALLQSSLFCSPEKPWSERYYLWKTGFDGEFNAAKTGIKKNVQQCIEGDTISLPPPGTTGCNFDEGYLTDLVKYYQDKRLKTQINYFDNRFEKLEKQDDRFRRILNGGFYMSIILVFLKLVIDLISAYVFSKYNDAILVGDILILLVMLSLPILAFAVRTLRSSTEVGRSASLYRAKRNALEDFRNRLFIGTERDPRNWEEIIKILWECENHLEEVNREWVRLMNEAEWFV